MLPLLFFLCPSPVSPACDKKTAAHFKVKNFHNRICRLISLLLFPYTGA